MSQLESKPEVKQPLVDLSKKDKYTITAWFGEYDVKDERVTHVREVTESEAFVAGAMINHVMPYTWPEDFNVKVDGKDIPHMDVSFEEDAVKKLPLLYTQVTIMGQDYEDVEEKYREGYVCRVNYGGDLGFELLAHKTNDILRGLLFFEEWYSSIIKTPEEVTRKRFNDQVVWLYVNGQKIDDPYGFIRSQTVPLKLEDPAAAGSWCVIM